jgi:hypothetical protein
VVRRCNTAIFIGGTSTTNATIVDIQVVLVVAELFGGEGMVCLMM